MGNTAPPVLPLKDGATCKKEEVEVSDGHAELDMIKVYRLSCRRSELR
jgi:hypothetical protein